MRGDNAGWYVHGRMYLQCRHSTLLLLAMSIGLDLFSNYRNEDACR